jgi:UDP-N-acetylmuramoyl-L-alanyl-D-glutamate--2,6-diaminopimelate ligase
MKLLSELIKEISTVEIKGEIDITVSSVSISSKNILEGAIFIAIVGNISDGHDFINSAIENGAKVIVHQKDLENYQDGVVYIKVEDTHEASGKLASSFYDHPSEHLRLIGVTGTNGKTTTTTLLHQLFMNLGQKAGLIGTVVNKINDKSFEAERTTPDPITLNKILQSLDFPILIVTSLSDNQNQKILIFLLSEYFFCKIL